MIGTFSKSVCCQEIDIFCNKLLRIESIIALYSTYNGIQYTSTLIIGWMYIDDNIDAQPSESPVPDR